MKVNEVSEHAARMGAALGSVDLGADALARVAAEVGDDDLLRVSIRLADARREAHATCKDALDRLMDRAEAA